MKLITIVGARPQFIKAAAVSRAILDAKTKGVKIQEVLVHTGQHYDPNMSEVFFHELKIPKPDHHLGVGSGSHGSTTGRMLKAIEETLLKEKPDWVLVYGDTNSTLAGALAAAKLHIPVAHVEAGLRSFNRKMPEEINRILTDHCSEYLFTPTRNATCQLITEGISEKNICEVGDVMYDAALYYKELANSQSRILERFQLKPKTFSLVTIHRAENCDDAWRLKKILEGLLKLAKQTTLVMPLHPRTKKALVHYELYDLAYQNLLLSEPVGYFDMIQLESHAEVILTDSGGVQKEAYFFRVPCITLREETEWIELVENGFNRLVLSQTDEIDKEYFRARSSQPNWSLSLYGDGASAHRIISALI